MDALVNYIKEVYPKFDKQVAEGLSYHRLKRAVNWIDSFTRFNTDTRTVTNLVYNGYRTLSPQEMFQYELKKKSGNSQPFELTRSTKYLIELSFTYGKEETPRLCYFYVIFARKGNEVVFRDKTKLLMPTLASKIISVGDKGIFIDVVTGKHTFEKISGIVIENGYPKIVPIVTTTIYKPAPKTYDDSTKAKATVFHYLLAYYGFDRTMELTLGYVPKVVTDLSDVDCEKYAVFQSEGVVPRGWIGPRELYTPTKIAFLVPKDEDMTRATYVLGNIYYIIDNFPTKIYPSLLNDKLIWRKLMGEITHSLAKGISFITAQMESHFSTLDGLFDKITICKLQDVGIQATNLIELMLYIFNNFNSMMATGDTRALYRSKSLEVEQYALGPITSCIATLLFNIKRDEGRTEGGYLDPKSVDSLFRSYIKTDVIASLSKNNVFISSEEDSTDSLIYRRTSRLVVQESNSSTMVDGVAVTGRTTPLISAVSTIGNISWISKSSQNPLNRINMFINYDHVTGTVLPNPLYNGIVEKTEAMLNSPQVIYGTEIVDDEDKVEEDDEIMDDYLDDLDEDELD